MPENELQDALVSLMENGIKNILPVQVQICRVDTVNKQANTIDCTALNGSGQFLEVRLNAVENSEQGFVMYPKVGSTVVVALLENKATEAVVVMHSQIEQLSLNINDATLLTINEDGTATLNFKKLEVSFDELIMNNGTNGAMVKLPVLQQEVAKNSAFLEGIRQAIANAAVFGGDGGAVFKTNLIAALATHQTANLSNVGNEKIKH